MGDIRFEGNEVIVEGSALKVIARDIEVDNEGRRIDKNTPHRRALVHDHQDGLTINWAKDYPGGVTIKGDITVDNKIKANKQLIIDAWDLCLDNPGRRIDNNRPHRRALVHNYQDGLTINWAKDYAGGVTIKGDVKCPDKLLVGSVDILQVISSMQAQIEEFRTRIAALETL